MSAVWTATNAHLEHTEVPGAPPARLPLYIALPIVSGVSGVMWALAWMLVSTILA